MRFGRKRAAQDAAEDSAGVATGLDEETPAEAAPGAESDAAADDAAGPHDEAEVDLEEREGIDLGSLFITPAGEMELRLQVDPDTQDVIAAVLVTEQGALELRAFAAARHSDAWSELRPQISAEAARQGGTASEQEGAFGTELVCMVPAQDQAGQQGMQTSRIIGHQGPRWLLRATLMGQPAVEDPIGELWEQTIRNTVVRRGRDAMAPGSALPLRLPPEAQPLQ